MDKNKQSQPSTNNVNGQLCLWEGFSAPELHGIPGSIGDVAVEFLSLGGQHCAVLTVDGRLWSYGNNECGQVGIGSTIANVTAAERVLLPTDEMIVDVCCGRNHTVCATVSGQIFCWGDNSQFQCGVVEPQCIYSPQHVPILTHASTENTSADDLAESHEFQNIDGVHCLSTENGHDVTSVQDELASNDDCQKHDCCHSSACHKNKDGCSGSLVSMKAVRVSCGSTHSLALSDSGKLWSWGTGNQIGLGDCLTARTPRPVTLPDDRVVIGVSCGGCHTVALVVRHQNNVSRNVITGLNAGTGLTNPAPGPFNPEQAASYLNPSSLPLNLKRVSSESGCSTRDFDREFQEIVESSFEGPYIPLQEISSPLRNGSSPLTSADFMESPSLDAMLLASTCIDTCDVNRSNSSASPDLAAGDPSSGNDVATSAFTLSSPDTDTSSSGSPGRNSSEVETADVSSDGASPSRLCGGDIGGLRISGDDSASHDGLQSQNGSPCILSSVPKSRSAFLDENQAKVFLQRQLNDVDGESAMVENSVLHVSKDDSQIPKPDKKDSMDLTPSMSPFAKTVESLLQHVPSSPVIVQEYVTNLTRSVVSNLRTSMDRRFNFVTSQVEMSLSGLTPFGKVPATANGEMLAIMDDNELIQRLGVSDNDASGISMSKSISMGLEPARFTHHRNGSLPGGAIGIAGFDFTLTRQCPKIYLETEVWSWGCGSSGQLGHADLLDRSQPCQMTSLDQCQIVKVAVGGNHTVALSATCQVYTWGDNSSGQLGHTHRGTTTPHLIAMYGRMPCSDIAAGEKHTLLLCDGLNSEPYVYYCGKDQQDSNVLQLSRFMKLTTDGIISGVYAGGSCQSGCTVAVSTPLTSIICELAASERLFHMILDRIDQLFIQPLLQLEAAREVSDGLCDLQSLANELASITRLSATCHLHLANLLRNASSWLQIANALCSCLLRDTDERLSSFQRYAKTFADSMVCGAFEKWVKAHKGFFDKGKSEFSDILEVSKIDDNNVSLTFQRLLQLPLQRPREFQKLIAKISQLYPAYTQEHSRLYKLSQNWQNLKQKISVGVELAEKTFAYWRTAPAKIVEALQTPGRRLVRDSRTHPLSLSTAGRFSSTHTFLLFNDCFVHIQYSGHQTYQLGTMWVEIVSDTKQLKNAITLLMPEDTLTLTAPSHSDKAEWIWCLNQTIARALAEGKTNTHSMVQTSAILFEPPGGSLVLLPPPRDRHGAYTFMKAGPLKDAQYKGMWRDSKIHGHGELVWPDGRRYCGQFIDGQFEGLGIHTQPTDDLGVEISEGTWKAGSLHGQARVRYSNGDVFKGSFVEGKKQGHGVLKQGKFSASLASVYVGQWQADKKHGYGICDDIPKGQKYMGMWMDDSRHGNGVIVTLDGLYFEGNFVNGKITGQGLLITEDNCCYEGEFAGGPNLSGKGVLTLPNGDYIEGQFNGSFSEGIKINGTFRKSNIEHAVDHKLSASPNHSTLPQRYGKLCVPASCKWEELFTRCYVQLIGTGLADTQGAPSLELSDKVWLNIAAVLNNASTCSFRPKQKKRVWNLDELQMIPDHRSDPLSLEAYNSIRCYLIKAFDTAIHPLSELLDSLVDAFLATYVGVGSHQRLLQHAVEEFKSYINRLYPIIRLLFPSLPEPDHLTHVYQEPSSGNEHDASPTNTLIDDCEWITPAALLYPLLLPKIYPPLFNLYALYNEKDDDRYWKRIRLWNKQTNVALMSYLGIDQRFWLVNENQLADGSQYQVAHGGGQYSEAIDRLQRISTSFSPTEKLAQIQLTFDEINKVVQRHLSTQYQWCMDDLFPVFQYIVVRSRIQHLAAEIHFIDDLMESHLQNGELGIMFTTLKACYFQILNEKVV